MHARFFKFTKKWCNNFFLLVFDHLLLHWIQSTAPQCGSAWCWPRCELERERERGEGGREGKGGRKRKKVKRNLDLLANFTPSPTAHYKVPCIEIILAGVEGESHGSRHA